MFLSIPCVFRLKEQRHPGRLRKTSGQSLHELLRRGFPCRDYHSKKHENITQLGRGRTLARTQRRIGKSIPIHSVNFPVTHATWPLNPCPQVATT